jgi:hypothetical protein
MGNSILIKKEWDLGLNEWGFDQSKKWAGG